MNPLSLILASAMGASAHNGARPMRPLPESPTPRGTKTVYPERRSLEESNRRLEAARLKRSRRRARRLDLAARLATSAALDLASSVALVRLRNERHPETPRYDLSEEIVADLLADLRWTPERISYDPAAAVRAWGGR